MSDILERAKERKLEQDLIYDRILDNERKQETEDFGDKGKFITSSYKKKLIEMKHWEENDIKREQREIDVTKGGEMTNFFSNLLDAGIGLVGASQSGPSSNLMKKPKKIEHADAKDKEEQTNVDREHVIANEKEKSIVSAQEEAIANEKEEVIANEKEQEIVEEKEEDIAKAKEEAIAKEKEEAVAKAKEQAIAKEQTIADAKARYLERKKKSQNIICLGVGRILHLNFFIKFSM